MTTDVTKTRRIFAWLKWQINRPLFRLGVTLALNLSIVAATVSWGFVQQKRVDCEVRFAESLSCFYADKDGMYFSFLPPQNGVGGGRNVLIVKDYPEPRRILSTIEYNLSREENYVELPGFAFWWSAQPLDSYNRLVIRIRFFALLICFVVIRLLFGRLTLWTNKDSPVVINNSAKTPS